jgi:hypothetical protein
VVTVAVGVLEGLPAPGVELAATVAVVEAAGVPVEPLTEVLVAVLPAGVVAVLVAVA